MVQGSDAEEVALTELARAAETLRRGGLVAFPTETVYGLGADATNRDAVARIFAVKGRPTGHPLIVHLGRVDELDAWATVSTSARLLADAFWPGPLTMILPRSDRVVDAVTGGRDTVGLRVPDHPVARALLDAFGGGIAAPSANRFGAVSPTTADHVRSDLGDEVDCILDGGPCVVGVESTIIDLSGDEPEVLRPGGVSVDRLREVLGRAPRLWLGDDDRTARAPGMLRSHYAPKARLEIVGSVEEAAVRTAGLVTPGTLVGVMAPTSIATLPDDVIELEPVGEPEEYAHLLYSRLRQADRLGIDILVAVAPPDRGVGLAVNDRLRRAAAGTATPG